MRLLAALPLLLASCGLLTADTFTCQADGPLAGAANGCLEFSDFDDSIGGQQLRLSFAAFCSASGFSEARPGTCPTEGRIGACREVTDLYTKDAWVYEGGTEEDIDDLTCTSGETLLGPDGAPYDPTPPTDPGSEPLCSPTGDGERTEVVVTNTGSRPITVYWGGFDCAEVEMGPVPAGGTLPVQTTVGHLFRVRAGERVPDALVVLDFEAALDGRYEARW